MPGPRAANRDCEASVCTSGGSISWEALSRVTVSAVLKSSSNESEGAIGVNVGMPGVEDPGSKVCVTQRPQVNCSVLVTRTISNGTQSWHHQVSQKSHRIHGLVSASSASTTWQPRHGRTMA
jgi:hypothetical protein